MVSLRYLDVSHNNMKNHVGSAILQSICLMVSLQELRLAGNELDDDFAPSLHKLSLNSSITALDLVNHIMLYFILFYLHNHKINMLYL